MLQSGPIQAGVQVHTLTLAAIVQLPLELQPPLLGAAQVAALRAGEGGAPL